jgi:DNA-binding NtrC family response regulator
VRILVVDDNRSSADALVRALSKRGDQVEALYDGASAIARLESAPPDVVLTDLRMEPVDGMEVLRAARALRPPVEVIVFTAYGAVDTAVEAMHLGARDFLTKPVTLDQLVRRLDELRGPAQLPADEQVTRELDETFSAQSDAAKDLYRMLRSLAQVPSPVWIEGEIGVGRGHAAYTMHRLHNPDLPFEVMDVSRESAWPESGTVMLPNVDDLPLDLQRQLVRKLQHVPEGVRVIGTAAPDARQRVAEGHLNQELYYKLAVIVVLVPPLRERQADILPLLRLGLQTFATRYGKAVPGLSPAHEAQLLQHGWPGNVRELLNVAERAVVLGPDALSLEVVRRGTPGLPTLEPGFSLSTYMEKLERRILMEALRRAAGDRAVAGRLLGVERNTLRYKLNKYGLLDK